jgi:hypothetical protein
MFVKLKIVYIILFKPHVSTTFNESFVSFVFADVKKFLLIYD